MANFSKFLFSIIPTGMLATLLACAGMSSSGPAGGTPAGGPSTPPLGIQNSLDAAEPVGAQGQAVPSTQQSDPGIGGPCGIGVQFRVRVVENGFVRNCDGSVGPRADLADVVVQPGGNMSKGLRIGDAIDLGNVEGYYEPMDYNPQVKIDFVPEGGGYFEKHVVQDATCEADGHWTTWVTVRWGHSADGSLCADYRLSALAYLSSAGVKYSSAPWTTSSVPRNTEGYTLPVLLIIDRGRTQP